MASKVVMAHGDNGLEPTREEDVAYVMVLPVGPDNKNTPATVRSLPHVFGLPKRLTGIRHSGLRWPLVTWRNADGKRWSCYVMDEGQASDPIFDGLSIRSRERIASAVRTHRSAH